MEPGDAVFDRLGPDGVRALVQDFYAAVRADPMLAPYFAATDMEHLVSMQHEYLTVALGGAPKWTGRSLQEVHASRGITERAYARFMEVFEEALARAGLTAHEIDRVTERMAVASGDILGGTAESG
jgi:hemoglobin